MSLKKGEQANKKLIIGADGQTVIKEETATHLSKVSGYNLSSHFTSSPFTDT